MSFRARRYTAFICLLGVLCAVTSVRAKEVDSEPQSYQSHVMPFFTVHCVRCHGPEQSKSDITLHDLGGDFSVQSDLDRWELILEMLASGEMPPEDQPQPGDAERQAIAAWIDHKLQAHVAKANQVAAIPTARRLTNFEYHNTMRDLLGFELNLSKYLSEDPARPYQFNNTAEFLLMGTEQMERYEQNASRAMASAIVDPVEPKVHKAQMAWGPNTPRNKNNEMAVTGNRRGSPTDGLRITSWPTTGEYRIRVKASAIFPDAIDEMPLRLVMGYNLAGDIGNAPFEPVGTIRLVKDSNGPQVYEFRGRIENHPWEPERSQRRGGTRTGNLVTTPANMVITPQNLFDDGTLNDAPDPMTMPRAVVEQIEFEAPVIDVWPPEHHTRIFFASPLRQSKPDAYVRAVLKRFMTRAFRRPVTSEEVDRYVKIYRIHSAELTTMQQAMRETVAVVLTSPNFLFHTVAKDETNRHYEVASRLSYFLWGTMPDQQLFDLANERQLHDAAVTEAQVHRMLNDGRARDFIRNFTTQWLSIAKAKSIPINSNLFPRFLHTVRKGERTGAEVPFRPTIRDDMLEETVAFVAELIKRNASVTNLIDSDFAMLNQRLAGHYGVEGVQGSELRSVPIKPQHHLGGLLTHGSVLIGNGTGSAPHPIYRAVWLREAILGDEVKDPPADVPALEDSAGKSAQQASTIKDLLRQHRQKESCNDCHARLDPWGIPFERYNAIGKYQPMVPKAGVRIRGFDKKTHGDLAGYNAYLKEMNTVEVEADAKVPRGPEVDGLRGLKKYLMEDRQVDIARNMIRRLLRYALGRKLTVRDRYVVEALLEKSKSNDYRLQDMIVSICQSDLFLSRENR